MTSKSDSKVEKLQKLQQGILFQRYSLLPSHLACFQPDLSSAARVKVTDASVKVTTTEVKVTTKEVKATAVTAITAVTPITTASVKAVMASCNVTPAKVKVFDNSVAAKSKTVVCAVVNNDPNDETYKLKIRQSTNRLRYLIDMLINKKKNESRLTEYILKLTKTKQRINCTPSANKTNQTHRSWLFQWARIADNTDYKTKNLLTIVFNLIKDGGGATDADMNIGEEKIQERIVYEVSMFVGYQAEFIECLLLTPEIRTLWKPLILRMLEDLTDNWDRIAFNDDNKLANVVCRLPIDMLLEVLQPSGELYTRMIASGATNMMRELANRPEFLFALRPCPISAITKVIRSYVGNHHLVSNPTYEERFKRARILSDGFQALVLKNQALKFAESHASQILQPELLAIVIDYMIPHTQAYDWLFPDTPTPQNNNNKNNKLEAHDWGTIIGSNTATGSNPIISPISSRSA